MFKSLMAVSVVLTFSACREPIALDGKGLKDLLRDAPFAFDRRDMPAEVRRRLIYRNEEFFEYLDKISDFEKLEAGKVELFEQWPSIASRSYARKRTFVVSFEEVFDAYGYLSQMWKWEDLQVDVQAKNIDRLTDPENVAQYIGLLQYQLQLAFHYSFLDTQSLAMCLIAENHQYCKYHEANKDFMKRRFQSLDFANSIDLLIDWMRLLIDSRAKIGKGDNRRNAPLWVLAWLEKLRAESLYLLGSSYHFPSRIEIPKSTVPEDVNATVSLVIEYVDFLLDIVEKWDAVGTDRLGEDLNSAKDIQLRDRGPWAVPSLERIKMRVTRAYALRNAMVQAESRLRPAISQYIGCFARASDDEKQILGLLRATQNLLFEAINELAHSQLCQLRYLIAMEIVHDNTLSKILVRGGRSDDNGPVWETRMQFADKIIRHRDYDWETLYENLEPIRQTDPRNWLRYSEIARMIQNLRMTAQKSEEQKAYMLKRQTMGNETLSGVSGITVVRMLSPLLGGRKISEIRNGFTDYCSK